MTMGEAEAFVAWLEERAAAHQRQADVLQDQVGFLPDLEAARYAARAAELRDVVEHARHALGVPA